MGANVWTRFVGQMSLAIRNDHILKQTKFLSLLESISESKESKESLKAEEEHPVDDNVGKVDDEKSNGIPADVATEVHVISFGRLLIPYMSSISYFLCSFSCETMRYYL